MACKVSVALYRGNWRNEGELNSRKVKAIVDWTKYIMWNNKKQATEFCNHFTSGMPSLNTLTYWCVWWLWHSEGRMSRLEVPRGPKHVCEGLGWGCPLSWNHHSPPAPPPSLHHTTVPSTHLCTYIRYIATHHTTVQFWWMVRTFF